jgi:large subunit ribosomal protein L24
MNRIKHHVKKGDQVEVISGNFRGSTGKILQVLARKERVLIEGVRLIHISNVKVVERSEKAKKGKAKATKEKKTKKDE